jgi:hypothetical protein
MPGALSDPPLSTSYGYSCKSWMAREVERKFLGGKYYAWFARELNPVGDSSRTPNGESSNPLHIYSTLDTAVKRKDVNHAKIKDLRAGLLRVISKYVAPFDRDRAKTLRHELRNAKIEMFHPQLWRLDLSRIDPARIKTDRSMPGWDEQYIADLIEEEFEVIAE